MIESTCLCGANRLSFEAEPLIKMRCHCIDCRKFSGSTNTNNLLIPVGGFKVLKGSLKTYTKDVESGNKMTSYFCGDCGSTMYRQSTMSDKAVAVMIGCIDGIETVHGGKADVELYTEYRPAWMAPIESAEQCERSWLPKEELLQRVG